MPTTISRRVLPDLITGGHADELTITYDCGDWESVALDAPDDFAEMARWHRITCAHCSTSEEVLGEVTRHYLAAGLWTLDDAAPSGDYQSTADDHLATLPAEVYRHAGEEVGPFVAAWWPMASRAGWDGAGFGHDLYLTREGHGTGFWDRGRGKAGDDLAAAAATLGEDWTTSEHIAMHLGDRAAR